MTQLSSGSCPPPAYPTYTHTKLSPPPIFLSWSRAMLFFLLLRTNVSHNLPSLLKHHIQSNSKPYWLCLPGKLRMWPFLLSSTICHLWQVDQPALTSLLFPTGASYFVLFPPSSPIVHFRHSCLKDPLKI